jgi:hypothetical protein
MNLAGSHFLWMDVPFVSCLSHFLLIHFTAYVKSIQTFQILLLNVLLRAFAK